MLQTLARPTTTLDRFTRSPQSVGVLPITGDLTGGELRGVPASERSVKVRQGQFDPGPACLWLWVADR
jgi:hypothetical protein